MGKIVETRKLYKEMMGEVTKTKDEWQNFLDSASWNFKYDFDDQLLIYAQRPDARAVASIDEWNKKLKRWINKGTNGIFVFDKDENSQYPFRIVFDISDTHNRQNTEYKLWDIKPEYESEVIEGLEASFGDISDKETLAGAIIEASYNLVMDNIQDYLLAIQNHKNGTMLENMSNEEIEVIVSTIALASTAYMTLTRCGINPKEKINSNNFDYIENFNSYELVTGLGSAVSDLAEMELREIAKTINVLQKNEKKKNRTIEKFEKEMYADNRKNIEGGIENGENRVHESRGLQYSEPSNDKGEDSTREIRKDEVSLFEGTSESGTNNISNGAEINTTLDGHSESSNRESTDNNRADEETRGNNRGIESTRSNEMGTIDEQYQTDSRGTSSEGINLQLEETNSKRRTLSREERKSNIDFLQDKYVSALLNNINYKNVTKEDIKEFYRIHLDENERIEYVKQCFNDAYTEIEVDNVRLGYKTYENVLHFWKDSYLNRTAEVYYDWSTVAEYIDGLILVNEFNDMFKTVPSYDEQMEMLEVEVENTPTFSFTQEIIDRALQNGSNIVEGKMRIYNQFERSLSSKENIEFLKKEYGWGGSSSIHIGTGVGIDFDGKGIQLRRGYGDNAPKMLLTWNKVESRIRELIKLDRYLNSKEKEEYPKWLEKQEQAKEFQENKEEPTQKEDEKKFKYEYHLGDTVYIGADEYEIESIGDMNVKLYDPRFPLFGREMSIEEFERKVKENPSNDHLKVIDKEDLSERIADFSNENDIFDTYDEENDIEYGETTKEDIEKQLETQEDVNSMIDYLELVGKQENEDTELNNQINGFVDELKEMLPTFEEKKKVKSNRTQNYDLHPEIPQSERNNYKITDDNLGVGTPREKFQRNIEAIKVLKKCEEENRYATTEEQEILSKYVGWGGLAEVFNEKNSSWTSEYIELKNLLDDEEYKNARSSTLTAFYTPPVVIESIYKALQNMGLKEANILEPSCRYRKLFGKVTKRA